MKEFLFQIGQHFSKLWTNIEWRVFYGSRCTDAAGTIQRRPSVLWEWYLWLWSSTYPLPSRADLQLQSPDRAAHQTRSSQERSVQSVYVVVEALRHGHRLEQTSRRTQSEHDHSLPRSVPTIPVIHLFLSASLYFSKRGAYWDRLCRDCHKWGGQICPDPTLWYFIFFRLPRISRKSSDTDTV